MTITIEIINKKVLKLLLALENLRLIRVTTPVGNKVIKRQDITQLKGAMSKQPIDEVESQLEELRNGMF